MLCTELATAPRAASPDVRVTSGASSIFSRSRAGPLAAHLLWLVVPQVETRSRPATLMRKCCICDFYALINQGKADSGCSSILQMVARDVRRFR